MAKTLMLDYIFEFVNRVYFHIGAENIRSQTAISRLGGVKIGEQEVTYFGEIPKLNFVYEMSVLNRRCTVISKYGWMRKEELKPIKSVEDSLLQIQQLMRYRDKVVSCHFYSIFRS